MLKLELGYAIWSYLSYIHFFLVCLVSVEFKSVYVRNLPSDISASEIEEEFKNFGTIKPDGVFLRTRKVNNLHFVFFLILFSMFILIDMKSQN